MKVVDDRLSRLAARQHAHPGRYIAAGVLLGALAIPIILGIPPISDGLTLNSDFTAMLPRTAQSVRDLDEIQARFGGQAAMILAIEGDDIEGVRAFTRELAPRILAMRDRRVVAVDWNLSDFESFVEEHRHLYADLDDLEAVRDALQARVDYERAHANPFYIDLGDEEPPDPRATLRRIERDAEDARDEMDERFPEGFFQHPSENLVLVVVHTTIRGGDVALTSELVDAIENAVREIGPSSYDPALTVHFGGTLIEARDETDSLVAAVENATAITILLVMLAIYLFFLRFRSIPLLSLSLLPPVLLTFAFAELTVDYLNASSAFLSSIVVGNGINPMIMWLSRYFEARRKGESPEEALKISHTSTWRGTLTASLAAGVAYGSLISTDYRGFRDFGIVGGIGMVFCWIAAYAFLPALTALFERMRPMKFKRAVSERGVFGILFARLALARPWLVLGMSGAVTVASIVLVVRWADDPLEYDWRNLRSERDPGSDAELVLRASIAILDDTITGSGLAVLAPSRDQAVAFRDELEARRPSSGTAYGRVTSLEDALPAQQDEKIAVLRQLRELMLEIRPRVDDDMQHTIDEQLPPADLEPIGPDDLPRSIARPFTERDGTRGRLLILERHPDESPWDGRYTGRWAAAARALRSPGADRPPPISGNAVVFYDLMHQIYTDGPRAIAIALLATALLMLVTFRRHRERWLTLGSLLLGVLWMAGAMAGLGMRLNFLNSLAFPITFGNGADYGVNVMRRFVDEEAASGDPASALRASIEGAGGAVILCSLTTVIGYISIHTSSNKALNSFGAAMAISETTCLLTAVLVLPALLYVLGRRSNSG
ncbi:MAG: RND family transporter [Sandaracinaceae bacterium]